MIGAGGGRLYRFFAWMLGHRLLSIAATLAVTGVLGAFAARVRTDPSIEAMFPVWDPVRKIYDRYKEHFPYDDARAIAVVEAKDLWTPAGLARLQALEGELARLPHVVDVEGPLSVKDVTGNEDSIFLERLFPRPGRAGPELAARVGRARTDPLFAWRLAHPELDVASIGVLLASRASDDPKQRAEFYAAATALVRRHEPDFARIVLTGIPAIRARYIAGVNSDMGKLIPLAVLVILAILSIVYRSVRLLLGAFATIVASVFWTVGFMGILDVPIGILTSFAPIIVMIISISDTVHIANDVDERIRAGTPRTLAVAAGMADSAGPCLLTEITIACGFLSLAFVNIVAILEFGAVTAAGMILAWLANMTVLPLVLGAERRAGEGAGERAGAGAGAGGGTRPSDGDAGAREGSGEGGRERAREREGERGTGEGARGEGEGGAGTGEGGAGTGEGGAGTGEGRGAEPAEGKNSLVSHASIPNATDTPGLFLRFFQRFLGWIERQIVTRPRAIVVCAIAIMAAAAASASRIEVRHFVFDDLWPQSAFYQDLRYSERAHGGLVPLAIYLEPTDEQAARSDAPALEPDALRFMDRAEARLRALPQAKAVLSPATFLRKAHRLFAGDERARADGGLPSTRALAQQEVDFLNDPRTFRDVLTFDRKFAAAVTLLPDMPSTEVGALIDSIEDWVARETPPAGYRASVTGVLAIANRINHILLDGLLTSFATAIAVSLLVFCFVLRSVRLAVIGLVPNLTPIALMLGVMAALGIYLKPSTVLLFSMVLTIADDDTIQYLSRFRRRFAEVAARGSPLPHREAALLVLRECGLPMFVTSTTISAGFFVLRFSEFEGTANIGLITAVTLFSAVFADAFLTPLIIGAWRPRLRT